MLQYWFMKFSDENEQQQRPSKTPNSPQRAFVDLGLSPPESRAQNSTAIAKGLK